MIVQLLVFLFLAQPLTVVGGGTSSTRNSNSDEGNNNDNKKPGERAELGTKNDPKNGGHQNDNQKDTGIKITCTDDKMFSDEATKRKFCWTDDDRIFYTDGGENSEFSRVFANETLTRLKIPCHGNFTFSMMSNLYWLNGSSFLRLENDTKKWSPITTSSSDPKFGGFLSRLRPNEALSGSFCCWSQINSGRNIRSYCYENGTYSEPVTDEGGKIQKRDRATGEKLPPYFYSEIDKNKVNCWFNDNPDSSNNQESVFNGTHWLTWYQNDGTYQLYDGELSTGIVACANLLVNPNSQSHYYLSKETGTGIFQNESGKFEYRIVKGTMVVTTVSLTVLPTEISTQLSSEKTTRQKPTCIGEEFLSDTFINGQKKAVANSNNNRGRRIAGNNGNKASNNNDGLPKFLCDLAKQDCENGFTCHKMPPEFAISCKMGFCRPASSPDCQAENPLPQKKTGFGGPCLTGNDCFTSTCKNGTCSCPSGNNQRLHAFVDYNLISDKLVYREICLSTDDSLIVGQGETCRSSINSKSANRDNKVRYCAFGSFCGKCPEFLENPYVISTCIDISLHNKADQDGQQPNNGTSSTSSTSSGDTKPDCHCGYLAKCIDVAGVPTCECPSGYDLGSDKNCFGWKIANSSECSVTCGNGGVRTLARLCDKAANSLSNCDGPEELNLPCSAAEPCPLDSNLVPSSVQFKIASTVLTVDLFEEVLESLLKVDISMALSTKCLSDNATYTECCPDKIWPTNVSLNSEIMLADCIDNETGITFHNKFTNGTVFTFYMVVRRHPESQCCQAGTNNINATSRGKRAALQSNQAAFDSDTLAAIMADPSMVTQMSSTFGEIDPYATLTASSIRPANYYTTRGLPLITPPTQAPPAEAVRATPAIPAFFDFDGGFPIWGAGLFAGGLAIVIIAGVTAGVIFIYKKKSAIARKRKVSAIPQRQALEIRRRFVLNYDATHKPIENDACYPSYYSVYPPSGRANSRTLIAKSAHEVAGPSAGNTPAAITSGHRSRTRTSTANKYNTQS